MLDKKLFKAQIDHKNHQIHQEKAHAQHPGKEGLLYFIIVESGEGDLRTIKMDGIVEEELDQYYFLDKWAETLEFFIPYVKKKIENER